MVGADGLALRFQERYSGPLHDLHYILVFFHHELVENQFAHIMEKRGDKHTVRIRAGDETLQTGRDDGSRQGMTAGTPAPAAVALEDIAKKFNEFVALRNISDRKSVV